MTLARGSLLVLVLALAPVGCGGETPHDAADDTGEDTAAPGDNDDTAEVDAPCLCDERACGTNACGAECECPSWAPWCHLGRCFVECQPVCGPLRCGDDGCGGACDACPQDRICVGGSCECKPECVGVPCGQQGCVGTCAACPEGEACLDGACHPCTCDGMFCGVNWCGLACGTCPDELPYCHQHRCAPDCIPRCEGRTCGDDGCGGRCGTCPASAHCEDGVCTGCDCAGVACGLDACGEACGECGAETPYCVLGACHPEPPCPERVHAPRDGTRVVPLTTVALTTWPPLADLHPALVHRWELARPAGARAEVMPEATAIEATLTPKVAGTYTLRLTSEIPGHGRVCDPLEATLVVTPRHDVHLELIWRDYPDTPPTRSGSAFPSDLDLHLAHPAARGPVDTDGSGDLDPWFDPQLDCNSMNPQPLWSSPDPGGPGNPVLLVDGHGQHPELLALDEPVDGLDYAIGVYSWDRAVAHSYATVRVYIRGELAHEIADVPVAPEDLWWVGSLSWPSGELTPARACADTGGPCADDADCEGLCGHKISPRYPWFGGR